ncbi:Legume-like lectin family protein [Histomonas meleagridis]|uniref:Legume-like lectin family protein n=1 Tax=Histomonas meleagridis TaxID=135588 RepID=UPI003559596F|nr:Legume-like lectin family protein [Histomonas meleagridis]KAH0796844.1 Legume-like lectin family protein [Histomonas meleagridis]
MTLKYPYVSGGICQRLPTYAKNWVFEAEIISTAKSGNGFLFFYTQELCTEELLGFHGIALWINPGIPGNNVYLINGAGDPIKISTLSPVCHISTTSKTQIRIKKVNDTITVDSKPTNSKEYKICTTSKISNLVEKGYFSLFASNNETCSDNRLFNVKVDLLSPPQQPPNDESSIVNRKYLRNAYFTQKEKKSQRRLALMPISKVYIDKIKKSNGKFDRRPSEDFSNSFFVIGETVNRSKLSISAETINTLLAPKVRMQLQAILLFAKIVSKELPEMKRMVNDLLKRTSYNLTDIAHDIAIQMNNIKSDAINYAKKTVVPNIDIDNVLEAVQNVKNEAVGNSSNFLKDYILEIICAIEFVGYILFFIHQSIKTRNFKKRN